MAGTLRGLDSRASAQHTLSQRPRDDFLHDLARAASNAGHAGIRPGAGDWIFPHVAVAAVELHAFVKHLAERFSRMELGGRRRIAVEFTFHVQREALVDEGASCHRLGLDLRQA